MHVHVFTACIPISFQIKHMMAFIEQEANEKAEEIDAKVIFIYIALNYSTKTLKA